MLDELTLIITDMFFFIAEKEQKTRRGCLRNAARTLEQAAREGDALAEDINTAALELDIHNAGFLFIAAEIKKRSAAVMTLAEELLRLTDETEKADICDIRDIKVVNEKSIENILRTIKNSALYMNLNAFNTTVEFARSGGRAAVSGCNQKIIEYAGRLHGAHDSCKELLTECGKLSGLLIKSGEHGPDFTANKFQNTVDNVVFQGGVLAMQLTMESERANKDIFKNHAKAAVESVPLPPGQIDPAFKVPAKQCINPVRKRFGKRVRLCLSQRFRQSPLIIDIVHVADADVFTERYAIPDKILKYRTEQFAPDGTGYRVRTFHAKILSSMFSTVIP